MAFDGAFLHKTVSELKSAIDCHIDKIYQPTRDELVFLLRKKGFVKRLLITVKSGSTRIHFTENKYENPAVPPNFCMLLRKHLASAKLTDITQPGLERIAELRFSATNELGDIVILRLICELIGNQSNVILVKEDGKIIDALKHSDVETAKRLLLPGAVYEYPQEQEKLNPLSCSYEEIYNKLDQTSGEFSKRLLSTVEGFSPLVCREIENNLNFNYDFNSLKSQIEKVTADINSVGGYIIFKTDNTPFDFSYTEIKQYGTQYKIKYFSTLSELLDEFYTARDNATRMQSAAHSIIKLVQNLKQRTEKKLALRLNELKNCENRETLRIYGELLKANLYNIKNGDRFAVVQNYYDENLAQIKIPLNPALTPAKNAEKYFKDYKKTYTAEQTLTALTENDRKEILYFDSVLDNISRCKNTSELNEIKQELAVNGYFKTHENVKSKKPQQNSFNEFTSVEGYKIIVGKNNLQNDYITTKLSAKSDLWFHVKNIAGSHVVVFCEGKPVCNETIMQAALLAAKNSKAAASSKVAVDYTYIKNVKKPAGAKSGMVIYTTNKTVFVNPTEEI